MYNIRVGYGCGIKATLLTASGEVCDVRRARYKGALLVLPNGSTIPCADVSVDDVTNAMYVRLLADRELTTTGKYGILFNVKMANGVMYSSPVIMFAEVSDNAEVEYKELNISFAVTVTYLPANVAYTGASPKISPNGTWLVFNDEINAYEDTGEPASYAGLRGDIQDLKDDISNKTTPIFITENTAVDWKTIGKNSKGELCVIGGDSEVSDYLAGYLSVNGYVKDEDVAATYATRKWVESKKYITFEDVPLTLKAYVNDAGYITLEAIAPYAKKADTLGGYGITNAYTKSEVDSAIFGALLPEKIMPSILIDDITIKRKADGTLYAVGGAGGGSIAYPLTWSGYSQGMWDGSAPANIEIPSLLSQLTNDSNYITTESVNSLLTDYVQKSGLPVYSLRASSSVGKFYLQKDGVDVANITLVLPTKLSQFTDDMVDGNYLSMTSYAYELNPNETLDSKTARIYPYVQILTGDNVGSYRKGLLRLSGGGSESQLLFDHAAGKVYYRQIGDIIYHEGWRKVAFTDSTMYPTGDIAMQFPDGEYIDRRGNIVLPSTASQWSVKNSNMMLLSVRNDGEIQLNGTIHFTKDVPMIKMVENGWAQSKVMWHSWDSTEGDSLWLQIPSAVENNVYLKLCRLAPSILNTSLQVNGNILATGEITQHSSLVLKDVVDTRFLTLKELVALKPYSFRWKDGRDDKLHAGAVADYVMPILPEVISTDKDNIHSMNYANAAWVVGTSLTPYVSKHEEEIEMLKERVKYLEDKLKECLHGKV